jgi:hypothetical protein
MTDSQMLLHEYEQIFGWHSCKLLHLYLDAHLIMLLSGTVMPFLFFQLTQNCAKCGSNKATCLESGPMV